MKKTAQMKRSWGRLPEVENKGLVFHMRPMKPLGLTQPRDLKFKKPTAD